MKRELYGEFIGTLILVLFGCGSVAGAVLFGVFSSLFEIALMWGIGIAIAIFVSRNYSPAHLNPAVSLGFLILKQINGKQFALYCFAQFFGAFIAAAILYFIYGDSITAFEMQNQIYRGSPESIKSAMLFGEYFPNPTSQVKNISWVNAMILEAFGTAILVFVILKLTEKKEQEDNMVPLFIGLTVSLLICIIAPFTQAGFNPARDFGPRVWTALSGWGNIPFSQEGLGFLTVYILGPFIGASLVTILYKKFRKENS